MNTEKKFYTLCGADVPLEDWVQTMDELQNAFNSMSYDNLLGVNPDPLLFYHQIPYRWLQTDPGFNILLRSPPPQNVSLPLWVLKPDEYQFEALSQRVVQNLLLITHHTDLHRPWEYWVEHFENFELSWTGYSLPTLPTWPREKFISPHDYLFHEQISQQGFYDINLRQGDTLSPLHIHLLQNNLRWLNSPRSPVISPNSKDTYYGRWHFLKNGAKL